MSHHSFFERIDAQFVEADDFTAMGVLSAYGPAQLRKHLLVMRFLEATLGLTLTEQDKQEFAERERIAATIADSSRYPWGPVIADYAAMLAQSGVAMRTKRMYISSATAFCNAVALSRGTPWTAEDAQRFLKKKPGSRANLARFFGFCRKKYNWNVAVPSATLSKVASEPPRTLAELKKLLQEIKAQGIEKARTETLAKAIAKSFGLRIGAILSLSPEQILERAGSLVLEIDGEAIDVPTQLQEITRSYAARLLTPASR